MRRGAESGRSSRCGELRECDRRLTEADAVAAEMLAVCHVVLAGDGDARQKTPEEVELGDAGLREGVRHAAHGAVVLLEEVITLRRPLPRGEIAVLVEV